mmetsp:Transcript_6325/g.15679  ORF Transcript_6325/g.15679 Transcript_6325/m.15679 type:complete len:125 (+) Transcript_6325:719-1093(+)
MSAVIVVLFNAVRNQGKVIAPRESGERRSFGNLSFCGFENGSRVAAEQVGGSEKPLNFHDDAVPVAATASEEVDAEVHALHGGASDLVLPVLASRLDGSLSKHVKDPRGDLLRDRVRNERGASR